MRLIDADALKAKIASVETDGTIANYCKKVLANCLDSDAPTVDAIPVEWLEEKLGNEMSVLHMGVYGRGDGNLCRAICKVLELWQKEQEAKNDA